MKNSSKFINIVLCGLIIILIALFCLLCQRKPYQLNQYALEDINIIAYRESEKNEGKYIYLSDIDFIESSAGYGTVLKNQHKVAVKLLLNMKMQRIHLIRDFLLMQIQQSFMI